MQDNNLLFKKNNFDLLRLIFAVTVCLIHSYKLSMFQQLRWITDYLSSTIAVKSFFVISGFLIFMSFERSHSYLSYASKRAKRIYPAYFTVIILFAICLKIVSSNNFADYFSFTWFKYIFANLFFLNFIQPTLPGVFETNKLIAVNGALWTLKVEVMFYIIVPFIVSLFRIIGRLQTLVLCYLLSIAYAFFITIIVECTGSEIYVELGRQLPGQLSYFMAGAFLYYYLEDFVRYVGGCVAFSVLVLTINKFYSLPILEPVALAIVVVFFATFLYIGNFGKYGDFSYGVYIIHFPVIQIFLNAGWFREKPWFFLIAVIFTTASGAILLWHLVEKRFLLRNSHYVSKL